MAATQIQKRSATMPTPPSPKKPGFFRRLGHRNRRNSSIDMGNQPALSPQAQQYLQTQPPPRKMSVRIDSAKVTAEPPQPRTPQKDVTQDSTAGAASPEGRRQPTRALSYDDEEGESLELSRTISKNAVRWAPGFEEASAPRQRRQSSQNRSITRRSSIYARTADGFHAEGVDAGVGSKARQLSKQVPAELAVEECPLGDHFSLVARMGKKHIGEGGAAVVQLMQSKKASVDEGDGRVVAVKEFRDWDESEESASEYARKIKSEYAIAKSCVHANIVKTYRLCYADKKSHWFHVMEYCDQGDLVDILQRNYFSREDRDCMFKQLLRGVEYLHSRGIAHRDLKAENLLLTSKGCLKIADFGTSEVFSGQHPGLRNCRRPSLIHPDDPVRLCKPGLVGSRPYMAPEVLARTSDYDPCAIDIWSCGIVYITVIVGGNPWEAATPSVNNYNIYCRSWERWLAKHPDGLIAKETPLPDFAYTRTFAELGDQGVRAMVMGMLHPDPDHRWKAKEALESQTVVEFACCQQEGYSEDIETRQRKAMHNHCPPKKVKGVGVSVRPS